MKPNATVSDARHVGHGDFASGQHNLKHRKDTTLAQFDVDALAAAVEVVEATRDDRHTGPSTRTRSHVINYVRLRELVRGVS